MCNCEREIHVSNTQRTLSPVSHTTYYSSGKDPIQFCLQLSNQVSIPGEIICSFCIVSFPAPCIMLMQCPCCLDFLSDCFYQPLYPPDILAYQSHILYTKYITNRRIFHNMGNFASWGSRFSFLLYWAGQRHCN